MRAIGNLVMMVCLAACSSTSSTQSVSYFPPLSFDADSKLDRFRNDWYSKYLTSMREPSLVKLAEQNPAAHVYRFTWLRSFDNPIALRLEIRSDGNGKLTVKKSRLVELPDRYEPGPLIRNETIDLQSGQVTKFLDLMSKANFWNLPSHDPHKLGLDGAQWIFEGVRGGKYHSTDRWSPKDKSYSRPALYLIELAKETDEKVY